MEDISSQALITAPALIYHLFPRCLKRCLTEFFPFKLASQNVREDFQKLLLLAICWSGVWMFSPRWCAITEAGRHKRISSGNSGQRWYPAIPTDMILMAWVPEASCPQLQKGSYWYCFECISFKERSDLLFGFFAWSLLGWLCLEKPGKPGRRRKLRLAPLIACLVTQVLQPMPTATLLKSQPGMDIREKGHIKAILL